MRSSWNSQNAVNEPSLIYSGEQSGGVDPTAFAPLGERQRLAVVGQTKIRSNVSSLLNLRSPSAVLGSVGAVVVDAVEAVSRSWTRSHVGVEVLEGPPSLADRDPATSITSILGVLATILHRDPSAVFRTSSQPMLGGDKTTPRDHQLQFQAATRLRAPGQEFAPDYDSDLTAIATAYPLRLLCRRPFGMFPNNGQASEPLARPKGDTLVGHRASPVLGVAPPDVSSIAVAS